VKVAKVAKDAKHKTWRTGLGEQDLANKQSRGSLRGGFAIFASFV
jgi:hypothetical protein